MAVAPASVADKIIVLDDEEEASPQASCSASTSSSKRQSKNVSSVKYQQPVPTHITQSPFASAKKNATVLQAENEKLFSEFVEHCTPLTTDCPEVLTFLKTKHDKANSDYLSSVEFRNALGRCLTRAQASHSKTFVYINELCTLLKQHAVKKRPVLNKVEPSLSGSTQSTSVSLKSKCKTKGRKDDEEEEVKSAAEEQPSTSGAQEDINEESDGTERKAKKALKKQVAYLENLLKMYNDEICRLQQADLSLDDMEAEDSTYIQEHKLKRKMMKIYEKLCELKGCGTLTGRVIEQRIKFQSTRYPEINKKIERFINSPEAHRNPPDYPDILQQVVRANERYKLCLSKKQLNRIAQEAFRDTGSRMQERRHLDLVYNFGSRLTDSYKSAEDPALSDSSLLKKLRSNREVALSRLDDVITKYAVQQEDTEEQENIKKLEKDNKDKEKQKPGEETKKVQVNGVAEEEEEEDEDDDEDESSDPDIEEEIQASTQQDGGDDDDENEEDAINEADQTCEGDNKEDQTYDQSGGDGDLKDEDEPVTSGSPTSDEIQVSPLSDIPSPRHSPSQSEPVQTDQQQSLNGSSGGLQEPVDSSNQLSVVVVRDNQVMKEETNVPPAANGDPLPKQEMASVDQCVAQTTNGTSPPPSPRTTRSKKRKREENMSAKSRNVKLKISYDSDADIPLDMGVISCSSPPRAESTRADTPTRDLVCSSQSTPPPKKNKVNVATQCDPDEIIVLSDSE